MKFRVFWDVAPCIHVEVGQNFNVTTRCYIPEDSKLHTRRRENLISHKLLNIFEEIRQES
jgi:hypothetical protein